MKIFQLLFFGCCFILKTSYGQGTGDEVDLVYLSPPSGPLMGERIVPATGTSYVQFKGVSYAEPPTGSFRFKDPRPKVPWTAPRSALQFGSRCPQPNFVPVGGPVAGNEDCLFLNIYTPSLPTPANNTPLLPVMVYIHGGGFTQGRSDGFGGELFMDLDVITVSINYRLGVLGYLTLGNADLSGNYEIRTSRRLYDGFR